jgi:flagellar basal-body rod modification protein FlgD
MAIQANVTNGQISDSTNATKRAQSTGTGAETAASKTSQGTKFDKDMFLKLLAAEMQYQDPMSPTENSQYVSEMATFSQVEATQNVSSSVNGISTANLVGKYVTISTDNGDVTGIVDYYTKKDDGIYIGVNDKEYKVDNVTGVKDSSYYEAKLAASSLSSLLSQVPSADNFTLKDEDSFKTAKTLFDSLSTYAKQFVSTADSEKITAISKRLEELKKNSN